MIMALDFNANLLIYRLTQQYYLLSRTQQTIFNNLLSDDLTNSNFIITFLENTNLAIPLYCTSCTSKNQDNYLFFFYDYKQFQSSYTLSTQIQNINPTSHIFLITQPIFLQKYNRLKQLQNNPIMHNQLFPQKRHKQKKEQLADNPFTESFRSKTQKAISLINKHENDKYNFLKTLTNNKKFINSHSIHQDDQYFSIIEIPQMHMQMTQKVQLLPYTDQMYKLRNPFFEFKQPQTSQQILEQDQTSSQGTIPIQNTGRTSQKSSKTSQNIKSNSSTLLNKSLVLQTDSHQAVQKWYKLKIYIKNYRGSATQLLVYFQNGQKLNQGNIHHHKYIVNTQKIIHINMEKILNEKWIYLRIKSKSQLAMFTLRVEEEHYTKSKKIKTDISQVFQSPKRKQNNKKTLPKLQTSKSLKALTSPNLQRHTDNIKDQQYAKSSQLRSSSLRIINPILTSVSQQLSPSSKRENKKLLENLKKQQLRKRRQEQGKKHEEILQKKSDVQTVKQKQITLKSKFFQMKKLFETYKVIQEEERKNIKQIIPKLCAIMYIPTFNKICSLVVAERDKGLKMAWKTRMLTKKFTKIIKRKYKDSLQHIRNRKIRQLQGLINLTTLFAKIVHKNNTQKSVDIILSVVKNCDASLRLNQSFDHATKYRRSIRYIQKAWQSKFHARMQMFQMYIKVQAQSLYTKYPYFKYLQGKFTAQKVSHSLAYKYMADESSKVKYLFEDYKQKLKQIQDFKQMNKKIAQFNSTALKKRQKPYLDIPKTPCCPSQRYFRNLPFLKSMIRGWFQLEYRKWTKANKAYLQSLSGQKQKGRQKSPTKPVVNKNSINGLQIISPRKQNN